MTYIHPTANVYPDADIGENVSIGAFTEIGAKVKIKDGARIGAHCFIPENVVIMYDVMISPGVVFANDKNAPSDGKWRKDPPTIVDNRAFIGIGSIIMPNLYIGIDAYIGAGSLLTKDVLAKEVWYGHPAKRIRGKR